ncbi:MAG: hypothetical protein KIT86_07160 [Hydrogenophaga sp.]|jgi:hypothetical protein|uniref:hypothetical protein n=1 Tax=Hydrogenophaga sp. TaxID=1904254 RepID=UPI0026382CF3|nr:hypothetical protein [Hydrogenophaga sp.]MCW5669424.1 hypothetical protein [Hydrogenophaga sp.]
MRTLLLGLTLSLLASASIAAPDPQCGEYDKLRSQRDNALRAKNFKQYCDALSGLIKLMPAKAPEAARLHCEAKATGMKVETWLGVRPEVVSTMTSTFDDQCR